MANRTAEQQRAYYWANRDRILALSREAYPANRERIAANQAAYVRRNPDKIAARRRHRRNGRIAGDLTADQWLEILESFENLCAYCGSSERVGLDHFVPVSKDGPHTAANVVPACRSCNSSKSSKTFEEWLATPHCPASLWL